ncbi:MAG: MerR family transcriptional regulator [Nitrospirae bacterium CG_4_9_14_3_um_filter_53_35]|nr:MAG: MerR family transcriptional regulator [Nitrospirae bacterium CG2_30_53_67]PIS37733.1 MAG: MerR family transcriptional regulator [Nitrospirae bacterium CG08_land_8_20_14_0_20_52_24]PIV84666.1 MAG: MerR family transcriptional regulator [Nitrospirae bacterium CG17_big_fil_post_rev_8_21_14_2_50_50_9]PIW84229.1 MAG: MerR family transcriptional regulator [Nitrospirae bacterium CG_4_8_14_3_um_filter_50_41]PIX86934.1 MAG: MerR family transcriptional regulator [Nitrospirae bacterium CG_4_10_14_3
MQKIPNKFFFRIGEVSKLTGVEPHVLRYWETEFKSLHPKKNKAGQRVYKKKDVMLILSIKELLYQQKYTIAGAKKRIESEQDLNVLSVSNPGLKDTLHEVKEELKEVLKVLS